MNTHGQTRGPVTVNQKLHRGLVSIPFPDLPMPVKRKPLPQAKPSSGPPTAPIVAVVPILPVQEIKLIPEVKSKPQSNGPAQIEEIEYLPSEAITEIVDEESVKDRGTYVEEPPEW